MTGGEIDHASGSARRIALNATILGVAGAVVKLAYLLFHLFVANRFGRAIFGDYTYIMNLVALLLVFSDLGVEAFSERELARRPETLPWGMKSLLIFRGAALVPATMVLWGILAFGKVGREVPEAIPWASVLLIGLGFFMLLRTALRSTERMTFEAGLSLFERLLFIGLGALSLALGYGLGGLVRAQGIATLLGTLVAGVTLWAICRGIVRSEAEPLVPFLKKTVRQALPFWLTALCSVLLFHQDSVMLYWMKGDAETGTYGVSFRLLEGLLLLPQSVAVAVYPTFSRLYHERRPLPGLLHPLFRFLFASGVLVAGVGFAVTPLLFGFFRDYPDSGTVLRVLLLSLPFIYGNYLIGVTMRAVDRQRENLLSAVAALGTNLLANLLLIPFFGAAGAAAATVLTQALYLAVMFAFSWKRVEGHRAIPGMMKLLTIGPGVWGLVLFLPIGPIYRALLGSFIFGGLVLLFRVIVPEDALLFLRRARPRMSTPDEPLP